MGIRSLLRNAFGRSKATREETGAAPSGADKPETATIPEAREESTPAPATPEAEVPAARTAPTEAPATDPAPTTPTLPAQGSRADRTERAAESSPVREESAASEEAAVSEEAAGRGAAEVREEPAVDDATAGAAAAAPSVSVEGEAVEVVEAVEAVEPVVAVEAVEEPAAEAAGEAAAAEATSDSAEDVAEEAVAAGTSDKDEPAADVAPATATEPAAGDTVADLVSQAFDNPSTAAEAEAAAAEAKAEPEAEAEAVEAKPEPEVEAKAEVVAEPEAKPVAKAEPAADAVEPEPEVAAEPEQRAAAADQPPADQPKAEAEPKAEAVTASAAAASLPTTAPALVSLYKAAGSTLEKHGLATQRAAVYLVLDRSGSMRPYYKDGTVQNLAEQALGLSAHLDDDATVPVIFFSTDIDGTADLDLANYEGRIEELHAGLGHMGRTNYHWAINAVVDHYKKSGATAPAFVIFQTDGAPTSKPAAEKALCEAAGLPIFWQFIGFGDPDAKGFDFLRKLDDLAVPEKRTVDNAGFFHAGRDPRSLSHDELYQQLMVEFPEWLTEARAAGVLKDS
ncbi:VWA domain-containing protein [Streptomyces platensis]